MCDSRLASEQKQQTVGAASYKPFSLQHWALVAAVKYSVKSATFWLECVKLDIPLFDDLRMLHKSDCRFLNYEVAFLRPPFGFPIRSTWLRAPLHILIAKWAERFEKDDLNNIFGPVVYSCDLALNIDTLKPSCSCRVPNADTVVTRYKHRFDCDGYMPGTCRKCTSLWFYSNRSNNKQEYSTVELCGHTYECHATE